MKKKFSLIAIVLFVTFLIAYAATTIEDFFLPGSQIGQSGNIESPDKCDNCHGGYDAAVEPAFNWRGSMMSQAARDPLFYACLAIANQDAPGSGDMCLRCHAPDGWLNGRCVPTDGSALNNNDRQGVQCDFCHKMVKPSPLGVNPYPGNTAYTSTAFGSGTYTQDQLYLRNIVPIPVTSANGMYIADANNAKRGPFTDAVGRHQMFYSPFHTTSDHCGTCHDVSNPAFTRDGTSGPYSYNTENQRSSTFNPQQMFPVERTFGEWKASEYNSPGTAKYKICQDCHMKDVTGKGAKMNDAPVRTNLPLHDFTGGNTFTPKMVKQKYAAEVNATALDAGIVRAKAQLAAATSLELNVTGNIATVKVINNTGHKFPTGYPEGRRAWIYLVAYDASNNVLFESGKYDDANAVIIDPAHTAKIYHCEPGLSPEWAATVGLPAGPSFHFAINNMIYFDNRIPPAGFTNAALEANQSPVIGCVYPDGQNWDITTYTFSSTPARVEAKLFYQTTTREYVEFLRDENRTNTRGTELYDLWVANGKSAPELLNSATWGSGGGSTLPALTATFSSAVSRITNSKTGTNATVNVLVKSGDALIAGALVSADFTGPNSGSTTATTNSSGIATLNTKSMKNPIGTWCFTITNVVKSGYLYTAPKPQTRKCEGEAKSEWLAGEREPDAFTVFPNPVSDKARIAFSLAEPTKVLLDIFDNSGRKVAVLMNETREAGEYSLLWDSSQLPRGIYHVRFVTSASVFTKNVILVK